MSCLLDVIMSATARIEREWSEMLKGDHEACGQGESCRRCAEER